MNIKMIGIDHNNAPIEYREKVAFSNTRALQFLQILKKQKNILGSILLSTCNRTEVWVSYKDEIEEDILDILCNFKKVEKSIYEKYFVEKKEKEAIEYLFMLTSGLKSKIVGEDQIISQIKNSVELARENNCLDTVLEVLFRNAITGAKKVKTEISFRKNSYSVLDSAINKLKDIGIEIKGKKCLVIGNGEMGRLAGSTFVKNGASVTMTLRQHHKGDVVIPVGVEIVNFLDRVNILPEYDIVVSTTSTNRFMLKYEDVSQVKLKEKVIFIDLAVPRDIDQRIFDIDGVIGFNIDNFEISEEDIEGFKENLEKAKNILNEYIESFYKWYYNKDLLGSIFEIGQKFSQDSIARVNKFLDDKNKEYLEVASKKEIEKLIFCLRDNLEVEDFKKVINVLEEKYLKED